MAFRHKCIYNKEGCLMTETAFFQSNNFNLIFSVILLNYYFSSRYGVPGF